MESSQIERCFCCFRKFSGVSAKIGSLICNPCFEKRRKAEIDKLVVVSFEEANHIIDNVFLGPQKSAINLEYLRANKIDRIACVAANTTAYFEDPAHGIEYLMLQIDDTPFENILIHFETVIAFIQKNSDTNVLVHCA